MVTLRESPYVTYKGTLNSELLTVHFGFFNFVARHFYIISMSCALHTVTTSYGQRVKKFDTFLLTVTMGCET